MKHTKTDDTCLARVREDEPIFVLRAQDASSIFVIDFWLRTNPMLPNVKKDNVVECMQAFTDWQREHPELVKRPD